MFPLEILFEEFYKKAIKIVLESNENAKPHPVYLLLNVHIEGHLKIILNAADR